MRIRYRAWQTWQFITAAPLNDTAWAAVKAQLTPAEFALFQRYRPSDRRHTYRVLQTLQNAGYTDPALLTAALLHDIGKTRIPLSIAERVLVVLAGRFIPGRAAKWGAGAPAGWRRHWRRAFVVKAHHAEWGADMAAQAGSDPQVVDLIRRHQDPLPRQPGDPAGSPAGDAGRRLRLLQWADDRS